MKVYFIQERGVRFTFGPEGEMIEVESNDTGEHTPLWEVTELIQATPAIETLELNQEGKIDVFFDSVMIEKLGVAIGDTVERIV